MLVGNAGFIICHENSHEQIAKEHNAQNITKNYGNLLNEKGYVTYNNETPELRLAQAQVEAKYSDNVTNVAIWGIFASTLYIALYISKSDKK